MWVSSSSLLAFCSEISLPQTKEAEVERDGPVVAAAVLTFKIRTTA
jgi:hypothetical protein